MTQEPAPGEAPAAPAWPTTAELGRTPEASAAPPPATSAHPDASPAGDERTQGQSTPAGVDAAALRSAWDTVLGEVKSRKRASHALLADATVASVEGRTLVLAFQHAPLLRQFQGGVGPDVLREALQATLGMDLDLRCVLHESLAPHDRGPRPAQRPQAPPEPAVETGFAPGDEAEPEDPDAPPPPDAPRGEDAALRLVESELGGRVMSTSGDD